MLDRCEHRCIGLLAEITHSFKNAPQSVCSSRHAPPSVCFESKVYRVHTLVCRKRCFLNADVADPQPFRDGRLGGGPGLVHVAVPTFSPVLAQTGHGVSRAAADFLMASIRLLLDRRLCSAFLSEKS